MERLFESSTGSSPTKFESDWEKKTGLNCVNGEGLRRCSRPKPAKTTKGRQ